MPRKKIIRYVNVLSGKTGECPESKWQILINHPIGRGRFRKTGEEEVDVPDPDNMIIDEPVGRDEEE